MANWRPTPENPNPPKVVPEHPDWEKIREAKKKLREREEQLQREKDAFNKRRIEYTDQQKIDEADRLEAARQKAEADRLTAIKKAEEDAKRRHDSREAARLEKLRLEEERKE